MMIISYKGLGSTIRVKVLWQSACLTLIWVVWWERNTRLFEDKTRTLEGLWDIIHFLSLLLGPSCTTTLKGIPRSTIQLDYGLARIDCFLYISTWIVAPYSCIDLLDTLEVPTYFLCSFFGGFLILLLYLFLLTLIYYIVVSYKNKK